MDPLDILQQKHYVFDNQDYQTQSADLKWHQGSQPSNILFGVTQSRSLKFLALCYLIWIVFKGYKSTGLYKKLSTQWVPYAFGQMIVFYSHLSLTANSYTSMFFQFLNRVIHEMVSLFHGHRICFYCFPMSSIWVRISCNLVVNISQILQG